MLFICGYAFAHLAGIRRVLGILMVCIGGALTTVAIAPGG
jgi:hypothetical protein